MMIPSPRLALLASILDLPTHRSPGCILSHMVYRGSIPSFHAALARLGVVHDWFTDDDGPAVGLIGLKVSTGGYGGVLVEDVADWDEAPGGHAVEPVAHAGPPTTPGKAPSVPPDASPATPRRTAQSVPDARRMSIQHGSGDPMHWHDWLDPDCPVARGIKADVARRLAKFESEQAEIEARYGIAFPPGKSAESYGDPAGTVERAYGWADWMRRDAGRE